MKKLHIILERNCSMKLVKLKLLKPMAYELQTKTIYI